MKFRFLMACIMGFITPSINAKMEESANPFPVFEIPTHEPIEYYKGFSIALLSKITKDVQVVVEGYLS